jgi:NADPH-dependent glutamate synthase beta subunit-like oxidoreductase
MADRTCPRCLDPEIIVPISRKTTADFKTGSWTSVRPRFAQKISPCRAACPAGNDIAGAARAAARGDFDTALSALLEESPLPGVCGRVCYHPCQSACNLIGLDGAVNIQALERAAADHGQAEPRPLSDAGHDKPVVVVGSGPAGLACAYHLARLGHSITLMEAADRAGGLLTRGIPGFRLPLAAVEKDLQRIWSLPVKLHTESVVDEKNLAVMAREHTAVFLSPGAVTHLALTVPGEELKGVVPGLAFLRSSKLQNQARGAQVVVIGGGNTALDTARTALRSGANRVRVLYRRTHEQMPAFADEVAEAGAEGVQIETLVAPIAFLGNAGRLEAVRLVQMRLDTPEADGRLRPIPLEGTEKELICDMAIIAAGQVPGPEPFMRELRWEHGRLWTDGWGATSQPGWFAGGDVTLSKASVVDAIATGKRAALGIHLSLTKNLADDALQAITLGPGPAFSLAALFERPRDWQPDKVANIDPHTLLFTPPCAPQTLPEADPDERVRSGEEVAKGFSPSQAASEADRCLCCGTCVGCDRCLTYCPEAAVIPPDRTGDKYAVRHEYCKGCGICASVCTRGVMEPGGDQ